MILGTISDNMTQNYYFTPLFGETPLRNSVAMVTLKALGDQKLFERVCYMLKLNITKFYNQLPILNLNCVKKASLGGGGANLPPRPK